jgi:hypothetical protein
MLSCHNLALTYFFDKKFLFDGRVYGTKKTWSRRKRESKARGKVRKKFCFLAGRQLSICMANPYPQSEALRLV